MEKKSSNINRIYQQLTNKASVTDKKDRIKFEH